MILVFNVVINAVETEVFIYSLPEDDDCSSLLDVLRPDTVCDVICSVATEITEQM